jgi:hypothetical protein
MPKQDTYTQYNISRKYKKVHSINLDSGFYDVTFEEIRKSLDEAEKKFEDLIDPEYRDYYSMQLERSESYYDSFDEKFVLYRYETENEFNERIKKEKEYKRAIERTRRQNKIDALNLTKTEKQKLFNKLKEELEGK